MAYEEKIVAITLEAGSGLAVYTGVPGQPGSADPNGGNQYRFVEIATDGVRPASGAGESFVIGVLQNKPQFLGSAATVAIAGVSKVEAGENISAGDKVAAGSGGKAEAVNITSANSITGYALTAGSAGEIISVLLHQYTPRAMV